MATADSTPLRLLRGSRLTSGARRVASLVVRIPRPLAILLVLAVALRIAFWLEIQPALMNNADSFAYLRTANEELFQDPARPMGYPLFMRGLHFFSADVNFTILFQHLLGIATALLLYATVRRIGAPRWAALAAAAAVLLSLDQVQFEHALLSEPLFTFGLAVVFYAAVRSLDPPRLLVDPLTTRTAWILAAGAALGLTAWVRAIGAPLVPFLVLWFVLAIPGRFWTRLGHGALAGVAAGTLLLVYFQLNSSETGHFGMTRSTGWALYARTAPIADCTEFEPPAGTSELCQSTDPEDRPGPDYYAWDPRSPAQQAFGGPPAADDSLGAFAREVVINQPVYYGWTVFRDWGRYFVSGLNDRQPYIVDYQYLDIDRRDPQLEQDLLANSNAYYLDEDLTVGEGVTALTDLQQLLRVHPILMLQAVIIGGIALWLSGGRIRAGLALLLGAPLAALLVASATVGYNARFAIPLGGAFIAAGAIGLWVIVERLRNHAASAGPAEPPAA